jgi:hypothetical protein
MEDSSEILDEAKRLRRGVTETLSVALPSVQDGLSHCTIEPWRRNRHVRGDAIHSIMSRVGGFPASLVRYLIAAYSSPGELIADPFCGKGTTLYEAALLRREAVGGDVAPDAVLVSRAKCSNVRLEQAVGYIEKLKYHDVSVRDIREDIRTFFHPTTLRQLLSVRNQVLKDTDRRDTRDVATFVCALILGILHGHSRLSLSLPCNQCFAMSPNYVRGYVTKHGLERPKRDVKKCLVERALEFYPRPILQRTVKVYEGSALDVGRHVAKHKGNVSLLLTSPPYLNRQTYVKDSWLRLWFLNRDSKEIATSSIETGSIRVFVEFLKKAIPACISVVRSNGRLVLVCGEAKVTVGGQMQFVRVSALTLYVLSKLELTNVVIEALIRDRKKMVRGSYFAVHAGKSIGPDGGSHDRFGEEDILVLRKK